MTYLKNRDFYLEVAKGNVTKHSDYGCFGINTDIDTGSTPEDIWSDGGVFTPPTTYRIHALVSSSASDTSAGVGARTIRVFGVVSTGLEEETITMNGVTPVNTVNSYSDIYRMVIYTAGTSLTNVGVITATAAVDATITASIQVNGYNASRRAIRLIPPGYKGYLTDWKGSMIQATANNTSVINLLTKTSTGLWVTRGLHTLTNSGGGNETDEYKVPLLIESGEFVKVQCSSVSANNTQVQVNINIVLIKD